MNQEHTPPEAGPEATARAQEIGNALGEAFRVGRQKEPWYARMDDDEWVDEVRIRVVPRYKTSGMSGDEWRVSATTEFLRKGVVVGQERHWNITYAVNLLAADFIKHAESGVHSNKLFDALCMQPSCTEVATTEYRLKATYCREGHKSEPTFGDMRRRFCDVHKTRGDCGLEDADDNYDLVSGTGPDESAIPPESVQQSAVVYVDYAAP